MATDVRRPVELEKMSRGTVTTLQQFGYWAGSVVAYSNLIAVRYGITSTKLAGMDRVEFCKSPGVFNTDTNNWNQGKFHRMANISDLTMKTFDRMLINWRKTATDLSANHPRDWQQLLRWYGRVDTPMNVSFTGPWWEYPEIERVSKNISWLSRTLSGNRPLFRGCVHLQVLNDNTFYPGYTYAMPKFKTSEDTLAWLKAAIGEGGDL
jgi:hypothetical protein